MEILGLGFFRKKSESKKTLFLLWTAVNVVKIEPVAPIKFTAFQKRNLTQMGGIQIHAFHNPSTSILDGLQSFFDVAFLRFNASH